MTRSIARFGAYMGRYSDFPILRESVDTMRELRYFRGLMNLQSHTTQRHHHHHNWCLRWCD